MNGSLDYGKLGGTDANLQGNKKKLNSQNEWEKALSEMLKTGELPQGAPAVRRRAEIAVSHKSSKQRAAIRR